MNPFSLEGKKTIITGGGGLIGRAMVDIFADAGAQVACVDINHSKCNHSQKNVQHITADLATLATLSKSVQEVIDKLGGVDAWINNAYPRTADWGQKDSEYSIESWQKNVDMQLNAYCLIAQQVAEHMRLRGQPGSIVNVGSIYGVVGNDFAMYEGLPMFPSAIYSAIKGGVINFSRFLASRYGAHSIRVNALCPGGVEDNQNPIFMKRYADRVPMKRMAQPKEIAGGALFLASDAASYVTGTVLMVDGGWTAI